MRLVDRPVSVRLLEVPVEAAGGGPLPLAFRVTTRRSGLLRCEASLWCTLVSPRPGFRWPPESRLSAEVTKVVLDPTPVGAGDHERRVELDVPAEARPTIDTRAGKVHYEVNVVAVLDERQAVANQDITIRSTDATSWIGAAVRGDGPWVVEADTEPGRPGQPLVGTVRIAPGDARETVTVQATLERFEEAAGKDPVGKWRDDRVLDRELVLEPGEVVELALRFDLPDDAVPTVMTRSFAERWLLTVTVTDGERVKQLATGVGVLS